jgi:hypothetical protein
MTTLLAPIPPSTNALWRAHRKGVRRSRRYLAWLKEAAWEVKLQKPPRFTGPVEIQIAIGRPDQRKRDLDNVATKALLDLLVQFEGDRRRQPRQGSRRALGRHHRPRPHRRDHRRGELTFNHTEMKENWPCLSARSKKPCARSSATASCRRT